MEKKSLLERCRVNTNKESDVFVGIRQVDDGYEVTFPLGYHLECDEKLLRRDILLLLHVLSRYSRKQESEMQGMKKSGERTNLPFSAYLFLIQDFFARGYYRERENSYETAKRGKICWSRTIKTQKPVVQGQEIYYLDYVVKKNKIRENELITAIHKYCVYESFFRFGWLFTSYVPPKPKLSRNKKMLIAAVQDKLQNTFNDRNKRLFGSMIAVLRQQDDEGKTDFKFGTHRFEYIWEKMIDHIFGIDGKEFYFPKTTWNLAGEQTYDNGCLEPDSIMIDNGKIYVLDAKYYKYGWSKAAAHLPGSASIHKQITYGEYIAENEKFLDSEGNHPTVYNAFLMPYDSKGRKFPTGNPIHRIGTATSDWKHGNKEYEQVVGILMDMKYVMGIHAGMDHSEIMKLAAAIEQGVRRKEL